MAVLPHQQIGRGNLKEGLKEAFGASKSFLELKIPKKMNRQLMKQNKDQKKFESELKLLDYIGIYVFIGFLYIIFSLLNIKYFSFEELLLILLLIYVVDQFLFKKFILFSDKLIIKYSKSFVLRKHIILIREIEYITFLSNNAAYDPERIIIKFHDKKNKKIFFRGSNEEQKLIDELRKLNVKVNVKSHIWK